jgi:hypothetical protein
MLKKLMITTAVSGLMLSAAMAQYSSPSTPNAATPNAAQSGSSSSDAMKSDASKSSPSTSASSSTSASGSMNVISAQKPDQLLASKFEGTDVIGANNEKIGDVKDILFTKDGKVEAYVISVGGFLGVGAKEIALAPSAAQLIADEKDKDSFKLKVSMTKDQLAQAPAFEEYKSARTTTGAGSTAGSTSTVPRNAPNAAGSGSMAPGAGSSSGSSMAPSSNAPASNAPASR